MTEPEIDRDRYRSGRGNWNGFVVPLDRMMEVAAGWADHLRGVERPWLCWNVNADWCLVQQDLVAHAGWTPVVGGDPRAGRPRLRKGAIWIDFNAELQLPVLLMHVPLEFMFLWADRLAFWHSDLIVRPAKLRTIADGFASLRDGEMAAVPRRGDWLKVFHFRRHRFWELIGCTTRGASRSQFEHGCGWWMHFDMHPNAGDAAERRRRARHYFDHGAGIMYWARHRGGRVRCIPLSLVDEGHFSRNKLENAFSSARDETRDLTQEITRNWDLAAICRRLEVAPVVTSLQLA
jgi:hypothetical protein